MPEYGWQKPRILAYLTQCSRSVPSAFHDISSKYLCNFRKDFNIQECVVFMTLREKCPFSEFLWSIIFRIRTEYGEIRSMFPYSVRMPESKDKNNSKYEDTFHAVWLRSNGILRMLLQGVPCQTSMMEPFAKKVNN